MSIEKDLLSRRIVTLGAGSGHFTTLDGLKEENDPRKITAIVAFADDGSDSGRLRAEFGILPPGDARRCILALAPDNRQLVITPWLNFRFPQNGGENNGLAGRNVGNLNLAALEVMYGCQELAIKAFMEILDVPGRVIPASHNKVKLEAVLDDDSVLEGEGVINNRGNDENYDANNKIRYIRFNQTAYLNPSAKEALNEAEYIIITPGDLYTSILPLFLVVGLANALMLTKAKIIYCGNLMTKRGETDNFSASDCLSKVSKYMGDREVDYVVLNSNGYWPEDADEVKVPYEKEGKFLMATDRDRCQMLLPNAEIVEADLVKYIDRERIVRHDGRLLAKEIRKIIEEDRSKMILENTLAQN